MYRTIALTVSLVAVSLPFSSLSHAQERERQREREHERERAPAATRGAPPPRAIPPRFQAHPPGVHPHGPTVRPHATRVMSAQVVRRDERPWRHWDHPEFARPLYYWEWSRIRNISCIAEDSYGDQYPVSEETFSGFGLNDMTALEDLALDRCHQESGGDPSCYLATCSHY
jgi:hypothetical protein